MKQVKFFDVYSNDEIKRYCVDGTEQYRQLSKILKHSDKDAVITYIEFDDGTNGFTDDCCKLLNIKIADTKKALAEFRKLSALDKYKECVHYGNIVGAIDLDTVNGYLTINNISIYDKNFLFILLNEEIVNCYELQ